MDYQDLLNHYGTCTAAAKAIGYSKQAVNRWKDVRIPEEAQLTIQKISRGAVKADPKIVSKYRELLKAA